jgi:hypothetical protein
MHLKVMPMLRFLFPLACALLAATVLLTEDKTTNERVLRPGYTTQVPVAPKDVGAPHAWARSTYKTALGGAMAIAGSAIFPASGGAAARTFFRRWYASPSPAWEPPASQSNGALDPRLDGRICGEGMAVQKGLIDARIKEGQVHCFNGEGEVHGQGAAAGEACQAR